MSSVTPTWVDARWEAAGSEQQRLRRVFVTESLPLTIAFKVAAIKERALMIRQANLALRLCFICGPCFISTTTRGIKDLDPLNPCAVS
jgi:hypothetical protein